MTNIWDTRVTKQATKTILLLCFKQQNKTEHWLLLVLKQYECDGETDSSAAVNPPVKAKHPKG